MVVPQAHPETFTPIAYAATFMWTILLAPLVSAICILLFGAHRKRLSATLAIGALVTGFLCTLRLFFATLHHPDMLPMEVSVAWIDLPGLKIAFGVLIDQLSLLMTLVVTGVGSLIFIYSTGYMAEERAYSRYFGALSLFSFSMLTIVLSTNWVQLFIGWELVGFSSYLLIGHWYEKPSAAEAGKKAFMVNRVADFGFLLGIIWLWAVSGSTLFERTFHFETLQARFSSLGPEGVLALGPMAIIGLLIFCGVLGKSAQVPFHVWLPDAMEGPTPVSALIHAATMVAAGVYLLCRAFWLFEPLEMSMNVIMWVGGVTAFMAACMALTENDLKKILAYSTLSQLGYMVMVLGLGDRVAGMYHLTTHAFFKALLFLGAGSIIHGTHEQDIRKLGGLWKSMRWTSITFLIGSLALCGLWPLSGFFSKDEILVVAQHESTALYILAVVTAGMTAFYTARMWFIAFTGKEKTHGHESPAVMLVPLFILATLSIVAGFLGIPQYMGAHHLAFHWDVALTSSAVVFAGLTLAWLIYYKRKISSDQIIKALAIPVGIIQKRFYFDEVYSWYVDRVQQRIIAATCLWIERFIIIRVGVNGIALMVKSTGYALRFCQTGKIQTYVLVFLGGIVWLFYVWFL